MPYQATVFNVMIASPGDVQKERQVATRAIADWNVMHSRSRGIVLLPLAWETHSSPEMGKNPQKILNKQLLDKSDLLVGIFWTRLGTPTDTHPSGTVEEIEEHVAANKPTMLYFSSQPVVLESVDQEQYAALCKYKASCLSRGLLQKYDSVTAFGDLFLRHLQLKLNEHPCFGGGSVGSDEGGSPPQISAAQKYPLSDEAKVLLTAAVNSDGVVMRLRFLTGTDVTAGRNNFVEKQEPRSVATWEAAVDELADAGLIEDRAGKREVYFTTRGGYEAADALLLE